MIPKIKYGKGFKGALKYVVEKNGAVIIGDFPGVNKMCQLVHMAQAKNRKITKPVFFMSLSLHPTEHLTELQWRDVGETMMKRLGYTRNLYAMAMHTDEPHPHIHIVGCRIRSDTLKVVPNFQENLRASMIAADLEADYGLMKTAFRGYRSKKGVSLGELALARRGKISEQAIVQNLIEVALSGQANFATFLSRCERYGVGVRGNIGGDHVSGISFELGSKTFKGSAIGYPWKHIAKETAFNPTEDLERLRNAVQSFGLLPKDLPLETQKELVSAWRQKHLSGARFVFSISQLLGHSEDSETEEEGALEDKEKQKATKRQKQGGRQ